MKISTAKILLGLSVLFSAWLYWGSDIKVEQVLTEKEWQSRMVTYLTEDKQEVVGPLRKVNVTSNVKYLPNGTYIRVSMMELYSQDEDANSIINISEMGEWELSDNYLLISPIEFKDVSSSQNKDFSADQLKLITQVFKMDSEQSRRVDIINDKALLLTSLNHGSNILFSN
ncbi:regulatory protein ToxS [Vibrio maerlii]|uniref:regulatory protein ToxS n=1 Tax=Vibrio maerlii TaxID=2231648 RepID=UPI000E3BD15E|nr:regulatory protein ToxS [Vibrio maerlii]